MDLKRFQNEKRYCLLIVFVVIGICITRGIGLTYNMSIHPDEKVFYSAADSLANYITGGAEEFVEVKEYPEGAYIFQMPFQLLRKGLEIVTGCEQNAVIWGRVSSVFYFIIAVILGIMILKQFFGNSILSMAVYGLTMTFSLYFIEHSRYGVGDMISLFLLMLIIYMSGMAIITNEGGVSTCCLCGGGSNGSREISTTNFCADSRLFVCA